MNRGFYTLIRMALAAPFMCFTLMAGPSFAQAPAELPGTMAYFRVVGATPSEPGTAELHLVNPDGRNDRVIYRTPRGLSTINPSLNWRPDGREIAFSSPHEFAASPFNSDIFAIQPDGTGLRRITNAPRLEELAKLPHGSVTVTVKNLIRNETLFFVYVEGATDMKSVTVAPGASATVTVDHVAELGRPQYVYIKSGSGTWLFPQAYADVVPGQTVAAANAVQISTGNGPFKLRITSFTWKHDGSEIAYLVEAGFKEFLPAFPAPGQRGQNLFSGNITLVNGHLVWSPVRDELLFYSTLAAPRGIYRGDKGSDVKTHPLVLETDYVSGLSWLPDGSGFLYSTQRFGVSPNQIIRFDFNSRRATVLVEGGRHLGGVVVSPDGRYFSFADRADEHAPFDLCGQALHGGPRWKIASDIVSWDWGPVPSASVKEKNP